MVVNRHIHGNQQAHTWQSTGAYMAVNRHIHGSQQAHGLYVAIVQAYKRYRDGNKKEQKWKSIDTINHCAHKTSRDKNTFNILLINNSMLIDGGRLCNCGGG